jgi:hypothetical protein
MKLSELFENKKATKAIEKWEDILHHIAEEELIACKVFEIKLLSNKEGQSVIKILADCNDDERKKGFQPDLSEKLTARLKLHKLPGLGQINAKVYHNDIDPR